MKKLKEVFSKERLLAQLVECPRYEGIDPAEVAEKLSEMAAIGATAEGGISRLPYTAEEFQVKTLFRKWMESIGLQVREDAIGNLFGRWDGQDLSLPVVMTGSHLDTVPNGGAFDGALGCLSSLMALAALIKEGKQPLRSLELVVFVDEEGARFKKGLLGSRVMMGEVHFNDLVPFIDPNGIRLVDAMRKSGFDPEQVASAHRNPEEIHAFVELHIEQGKILENEQRKIGVVNGIAGPVWTTFMFHGSTDHAGNTPMHLRKDTVVAAAEFITGIEKLPRQFSETAVATVGKVNVFPNGTNVIAGKTEVVVDVRDIVEQTRDQLLTSIIRLAQEIAEQRELTVEIQQDIAIAPVQVPEWIQQKIAESASASDLPFRYLPSGAGHDAMIIGKYVPSGMIFVPSLKGKSHSPEEWTSLPDCLHGIQILKDTLYRLANE